MKKFVILALGLAIAGCDATPEEQEFDLARVQKSLPAGCEVHYAGTVRVVDSARKSRVFYTMCGKTTTTTETHTEPQGKSSYEASNVTVNDAAVVGVVSQM